MKRIQFLGSLLVIATAFVTGCKQDINAINDGMPNLPMGAKSAAVNPAWVFPSTHITAGRGYYSIAVSNDDGSNFTQVYTCSVTTNQTFFATWSANGTSASFVEMPILATTGSTWYGLTQWGNYAIKALDISVSNGRVSGKNVRTIYSTSTSDSMKIVSQAWCPSTSGDGAGKIAFLVFTPTESRIYLIPTSGGTPTLIYSTTLTDARLHANSLTWSNDGNKLAFDQFSGTNTADADVTHAIKIIDLSGNVQTTLLDGYKTIEELQWSNAGLDEISFEGSATGTTSADLNLYTVGTTSGSTPTLIANGWDWWGLYWSPDNSQLAYRSGVDNNTYKYTIATGTTTKVGNTPCGDWK